MGIIIGLVLLLVAVVTGAVIWRKKRSGREGREGPKFSCLSGVSSPGRSLPAWLLESTSTRIWSLELMLTFFFSKACVKMKYKFFTVLIPVGDQVSST